MKYDVLIIGGGACGMMAALTAKDAKAKVCILEKNSLLGKKLLATGNGRCNFTNEYQDFKCYRAGNADLIQEVFSEFNVERTLVFFSKIGILAKSKAGYYYPRSNQASAVRYCLEKAVIANEIDFRLNTEVLKVFRKDHLFVAETSQGTFSADKCIVCTGGKASPKSGSDGFGYKIAKGFGHHIIKPLPALVQLKCKEKYFKSLKGVRAGGKVSLFVNGQPVASDEGEIQFTKEGISGIPVFNISRFATTSLNENKNVVASLDLFYDFSFDVLYSHLSNQLLYRSYPITIRDGLVGMLNESLIPVVLKEVSLNPKESIMALGEEDIRRLASFLKDWRVEIIGSNDFDSAQVTCGGVDLNEVSSHLESKITPGLLFAGEVLDVDGICGGYNLQWAWSSGFVAGANAMEN